METHEMEELRTKEEAALTSLLRNLIRPLVKHPDEVRVSSVHDSDEVTFRVQVAVADFGRVTGPQGRTAESLGVIVRAAGIKANRRFTLSIDKDHIVGASQFCN